MFQYDQICRLNESEFGVYNYIFSHLPEIENMSIRDVSKAAGVSTTTVLRFCSKMGCDGYTEFKYKARQSMESRGRGGYFSPVKQAVQYLQAAVESPELDMQLKEAARICAKARQVLFFGIGPEGGLGEFGARLLCSMGVAAFSLADPFCFYPPSGQEGGGAVLFVLSVSGETPAVVTLADKARKKQMQVISITNTSQCTVARLSEINFAYFMPLARVYQDDSQASLTTQVPVVFLLELLAAMIYELKEESKKF